MCVEGGCRVIILLIIMEREGTLYAYYHQRESHLFGLRRERCCISIAAHTSRGMGCEGAPSSLCPHDKGFVFFQPDASGHGSLNGALEGKMFVKKLTVWIVAAV